MLLSVVAFAILVYGAILGLLYWQSDRILFAGNGERGTPAKAGLDDFTEIRLSTQDGEQIAAWWKPPEPGRALILYFHGNGGSLWNRRERARMLSSDGRGVLLASYRGYSGSTGRPSEDGLAKDAEAAYAFLASYAPRRIVVYGESLGTAVAIRLASRHSVGGIVLDAPFTSVADVGQALLWFVPVGLLEKRFRSIDRIGSIDAPLLALHGDADRVIPIVLGERLFAAAPEPKRFVRLPGVDHVSVLEAGGLAEVRTFLDAVERTLAAPAR